MHPVAILFPTTMPSQHVIRDQVLRGIALNRTPGFHFPGNFLGVEFDRQADGGMRIAVEPGPHCIDGDGDLNIGVIALVADIALAGCVRTQLSDETRLATVCLQLQFTNARARARLEAHGTFEGFLRDVTARQGLSRVAMTSGGESIGYGTGAFMVLRPPPGVAMHAVPMKRDPHPPRLADDDLDSQERAVLHRADVALEGGNSFIERFWGYLPRRQDDGAVCEMPNGAHVGNRVGHAQGGVLVGLAATTASAALPPEWSLSAISAWYLSPGEGDSLTARASVMHPGRQVATVHTVVSGVGGRKVLDVVSTHARRA